MTSALTASPPSPARTNDPNPGPKPNGTSHPSPLSLLSHCSSLGELRQLHALAIKSRLHNHPSLLTKLITFSSSHPSPFSMDYARQLFDRIPHPDVVLFNTMSRGYSLSPTPREAVLLFARMLESSVFPDNYTFPSLLKAYASAKALEEGKQAHGIAVKLGLADNVYVLPTLINMYAQCGHIRAARALFDRTDGRCVVSYNSMITACVRSSRPGKALALFRELQAKGLRPTDVTMLSVIASCALLGALELGKWIHDYVRKSGFGSHNVKVNTALIDMYAKSGSLKDAARVFQEMGSKDTQAWSAMIVAYGIHGRGGQAISLFEEMQRKGIKPDGITFLGLLYACSHSGMVDEGLRYFYSIGDYGIVPGIKHYGCVVDLLARAGRLNEAYEFVDGLPIKPTPILWRTLLSACGGHGDVDLGKRVFERILELDGSHGGDYVILSNMCAADGRWEDVNRIRKLMAERGAVKVPGCSSIEVDNVVHEFFSGDGNHPQSREVRRMVDEVVEQIKLVGYVPDTSRVFHPGMGEEEKEENLRYHSEKLAIAFGLLNSPPGTTIRVVKNLRVCRDCHLMAKAVSMVFDREIVLRDLNRFHHFEKGLCSCGDYW